MSSGPVSGSSPRRTTSTTPPATPPAAKKTDTESPLTKTLASHPEIRTNQDLINHLFKTGGGTFQGAHKAGKEMGVDVNELVKNREGLLPGREAAPSTETRKDAYTGAQDFSDADVTGRRQIVFSSGGEPTLKTDPNSKALLDQNLTQARLGTPRKDAPATNTLPGNTTANAASTDPPPVTNLDAARGAMDVSASHADMGMPQGGSLHSGTQVGGSWRYENGGTVTDRTRTTTTQHDNGGSTSVSTRSATVSKNGATMKTTSADVTLTNPDGSKAVGHAKTTEHNGKTRSTSSGETEAAETKSAGQRAKDTLANTKATIFHKDVQLASGSATKGLDAFNKRMIAGTDPQEMQTGKANGTAAGAKLEVGSYEVKAGYGAYAQKGKLYAGGDISASATVVGVSGRAQLGRADSIKGQAVVQGQAKVGADATAGGRAAIDLSRNPTVELSAGAKAFAGAKAEASVSYQNRYGGVTAKGEASAGIGGEVGGGVSFKNGRLKIGASLSGTLGVGLGGRVDVDVNVGAMARDAYNGVKSAGSWVGKKLGWW